VAALHPHNAATDAYSILLALPVENAAFTSFAPTYYRHCTSPAGGTADAVGWCRCLPTQPSLPGLRTTYQHTHHTPPPPFLYRDGVPLFLNSTT